MTVESLLERQADTRAQVLAQVRRVAALHWQTLGSWNREDISRFVDATTPLVRAGQLQTAALTDVYIASVLTEMSGEPVRPIGVDPALVTEARGVPPRAVYERPFVEVWSGLKNGQLFDSALAVGADRLLRLVEDDLSLAHRTQTSAAYSAHGSVQRYRRVLRPYKSRGGTCGLCIAASDQTYHDKDLLPIHGRCKCETLPIVGAEDPGRAFNGEDIPTLYARAAEQAGGGTNAASTDKAIADGRTGQSAVDLKRVRVQIRQHGELGPVLTEEGAGFTGPSAIPA